MAGLVRLAWLVGPPTCDPLQYDPQRRRPAPRSHSEQEWARLSSAKPAESPLLLIRP